MLKPVTRETKSFRAVKLFNSYRMAGNFRRVLIVVIFVVDLAVTKVFHLQKLMPTVIINYGYARVHDDGRGHKHCGSTANTSQCE